MNDYLDEKEQLKQQLAIEREQEDLKQVMASQQGRRFIWKQLSTAGVFATSFTTDPYITAFNEGSRNKGLELFNDIMKFCPDQYLLMAEEARTEQENKQ